MKKIMTQEEFEKYLDAIYDCTLINSLIFSFDIKNDINVRLKQFDNETCEQFIQELIKLVEHYKNYEMFDKHIKNNIYDLMDYLLNVNNNLNKEKKCEYLNELKLILNNCSNDNTEFIRNQISIRDYGLRYNKNKFKLRDVKNASDSTINSLKGLIYDSISYDIDILNLMESENHKEVYEKASMFFATKAFYRSLNYFLVTNQFIFFDSNKFEKIKYVLDENIKKIYGIEDEIELEKYDDEFFDIASISTKLVKKIERKI